MVTQASSPSTHWLYNKSNNKFTTYSIFNCFFFIQYTTIFQTQLEICHYFFCGVVLSLHGEVLPMQSLQEPLWGEARATPCQTKRVPAAPAHPPQGIAEPLSQGGGTSGKVYVRKGQMLLVSKEKKKGKQSKIKTLQTPSSEKEDRDELLHVPQWKFSGSPWRRPQWSRHPHCSLWRTPILEQVAISWRNCSRWRPYTKGGFPHSLWRGPMLEHFMKDYCPWEGPTLKQRKSVRRKEPQRGAVTDRPQPPFPTSCTIGLGEGKRVRNERANLSKGEGQGWRFTFCPLFLTIYF